jgi:hypothetical protein
VLTTISFDKRPDIRAPVLEISLKNDGLISPGYLFLAPYSGDTPGPYIYDNNAVCLDACCRFSAYLMRAEPYMERC